MLFFVFVFVLLGGGEGAIFTLILSIGHTVKEHVYVALSNKPSFNVKGSGTTELPFKCLDCGMKPKGRKVHRHGGKIWQLHTEKPQKWNSKFEM